MADTGQDREHGEALGLGARWLVDQRGMITRPIVELRARFGLRALEATEACALAGKMRSDKRTQ